MSRRSSSHGPQRVAAAARRAGVRRIHRRLAGEAKRNEQDRQRQEMPKPQTHSRSRGSERYHRDQASSATLERIRSGVIPLPWSTSSRNLPVRTSQPCRPARWAPSTSHQRSSPTIATDRSADSPRLRTAASKNAGLGFPATAAVAPAAYSSAATKGPASSASRLALAEVAVAGEGHQRRAGHQLLERLLQQREGPPLAEVAQHHRVGRGPRPVRGAPARASSPSMSSSAPAGTNGATRPYPAARTSSTPARVAVTISSGATASPYPASRSTSMRRERLVVLVTSRKGTARARSRDSARRLREWPHRRCTGCRRDRARKAEGVEVGMVVASGSHRLSCTCSPRRIDYAGHHAARPRRAARPSDRSRTRSPWGRPWSTRPSSGSFPIGTARMTVNPMTRERGRRSFRLRGHGCGPADGHPGRRGPHLIRRRPRVQLAAVPPQALPGRERGRVAVPDRPRFEPVPRGRRPP